MLIDNTPPARLGLFTRETLTQSYSTLLDPRSIQATHATRRKHKQVFVPFLFQHIDQRIRAGCQTLAAPLHILGSRFRTQCVADGARKTFVAAVGSHFKRVGHRRYPNLAHTRIGNQDAFSSLPEEPPLTDMNSRRARRFKSSQQVGRGRPAAWVLSGAGGRPTTILESALGQRPTGRPWSARVSGLSQFQLEQQFSSNVIKECFRHPESNMIPCSHSGNKKIKYPSRIIRLNHSQALWVCW